VASRRNGTLYTGVTSNPLRRAFEHRQGLIPGFSTKHGCKILVWYEQIKAGSRAKKLALIEGLNPEWNDLYSNLI
jgi:putative endonuclease